MDAIRYRFVRPPNPRCEACHERTSDTFVLHVGWRCYDCLKIPGRVDLHRGSNPGGIVGGNHQCPKYPA
jgi:hypothetical protein